MKFILDSHLKLDHFIDEDRTSVRNFLTDYSYEVCKRNQFSVNTYDYYTTIGLMVNYDEQNICEALEFNKDAEIFLFDNNIMSQPANALYSLIKELDNEVIIEPDGFTSNNLCMGCYLPDFIDAINLPPESIIIFRKGYYD